MFYSSFPERKEAKLEEERERKERKEEALVYRRTFYTEKEKCQRAKLGYAGKRELVTVCLLTTTTHSLMMFGSLIHTIQGFRVK